MESRSFTAAQRQLNRWLAALAILAIVLALSQLRRAEADVRITPTVVGTTPVTLYRPADGRPAPVVLIAHGFAGSQELMQSFALCFARNGYIAVTFDFPGHGRNPRPLTGSITQVNGATQTLLHSLEDIGRFARGLGDGRMAVLGHSMASDIVVRYAEETPTVAATIAVSMFSPAVTASAPRDLLVIAGDWEGMLKREALRAVNLAIQPALAVAGHTYGDMQSGTARRAAFSAHVEHVSVLFSQDSLRESLNWLDQAFGTVRTSPARFDARGPWIMLLIGGLVLLGRPLSTLLPRLAAPPLGAGRAGRRLWLPLLLPMVATPLLLRVVPTHFLPVLVGDYLAAHFALYGILTAACLYLTRRVTADVPTPLPELAVGGHRADSAIRFGVATAAVIAYGFVAIVWPINSFFTAFVPGPARTLLVLAMLIGTLSYFLADEWLTRGVGAARGAYAASKVALVISLAFAVYLDFERLFFLVIIVPVILLFFVVYGLISSWAYRRTGQPLVGAIACAVALAWAIGVTFPLLAS